jgi:hypothetical protein
LASFSTSTGQRQHSPDLAADGGHAVVGRDRHVGQRLAGFGHPVAAQVGQADRHPVGGVDAEHEPGPALELVHPGRAAAAAVGAAVLGLADPAQPDEVVADHVDGGAGQAGGVDQVAAGHGAAGTQGVEHGGCRHPPQQQRRRSRPLHAPVHRLTPDRDMGDYRRNDFRP